MATQRLRPTMRPHEAAEVLGVETKTVNRYGDEGLLNTFRTPGNHRRFFTEEVLALRASGAGSHATA